MWTPLRFHRSPSRAAARRAFPPEQGAGETILRLERITLRISSGRFLLDNVDLTVRRGEFIVIEGPSGSGKTSLLRLINRLSEPTSGRILYRGIPLEEIPVTQLRGHLQYLHQTPVLLEGSIAENLLLPFRFRSATRLDPPSVEEMQDWMDRLLLSHVALDKAAESCSIGEKQRICLIRALLLKPDVLLLDEPTSALDPESCRIVDREIERANAAGTTVLLVTHRLTDRLQHAAYRRWRLQNGHIRENSA